jgi:hypothetical protein
MATPSRSIFVLPFIAVGLCGGGAETILCTSSGTHCASYQSFMIPAVAWGVLKNHALP